MSVLFRKLLIVVLLACVGQGALADVTCSFNMRSTISSQDRLDDYGFRVREANRILQLEQRYADDEWQILGPVQRFDRSGFTVFLHLPTGGAYVGRARMLTIHENGNGSLAIHHGLVGGGSQIGRAWLYQGTCTERD
jgi:hypothetical protein